MNLQKKVPWRSKKYLEWVKTISSVLNESNGSDAHHMKGHGMGGTVKAPDWAVFPLTREEHEEFHKIGWRTWEEKYGSQWEFVARTMAQAIIDGVLK